MKKKILLIAGGILLVLFAAAVVIPLVYKDKIKAMALEAVNEQLNAQISFGDFSLSLLRDFPNLSMQVSDFQIVGVDSFATDTLANVGSFGFSMSLMPIIQGQDISIRKISVEDARFHIRVLASGLANYDIVKADTSEVETADTAATEFRFAIKAYTFKNVDVVYDDRFYAQKVVLKGIDHSGKGDFTQDDFVLKTQTLIDEVSYAYAGVPYISKARASLDVPIAINMPAFRFTFTENRLQLNDLVVNLAGMVAMPYDDIDMDLRFSTPQSDFKALLSVVPGMYNSYFADVKTKGNFKFAGELKGTYNDLKMPAFNFELGVDDGFFQYPDLPEAVRALKLDLKINNPNGDLDATIVDLKQFSMDLGGNPFSFTLFTTKPISDPTIAARLNAAVDFAKVKRFIPGELVKDLQGKFTANVIAEGKVNAIEQQRYKDITLAGEMALADFYVSNADFPDGVKINRMEMGFSPQFVALHDFSARFGSSDIRANGRIDNLLAFYFEEDKLKGSFNLGSNLLNLNELMGDEAAATPDTPATASAALSVIEIPAGIDFNLNARIVKILYDNMEINNLQGNLRMRDQQLGFNDVNMQLLGGSIQSTGNYDTRNPKKPQIAFSLGMQDFDLKETFSTFVTMQKIAPIGQYTSGRFSTGFQLNGVLLQDMTPDLNSLAGGGLLKIPNATIAGFKPLEKAAELLKMDQLKTLKANNVNLTFEFENGRVYIQPFEIVSNGIKMTISGSNSFDMQIDYNMLLQLPREQLGGANTAIDGLLKQAAAKGVNVNLQKTVDVKVKITGLVNDPKVNISLIDPTAGAGTDLKQQALDEFEKRKKELEDKAREEAEKARLALEQKRKEAEEKAKAALEQKKAQAKEEAAKILADAQQQADRLKAEAKVAAQRIRTEGDAAANKLIAEAGSNPLKKVAAEKTAEGIRKEANNKANQLEAEAARKADALMDEARKKAAEKLQ
jgi:hypothetical protein